MKCPFSIRLDGIRQSDGTIDRKGLEEQINYYSQGVVVGCGKCEICKRNRAAEWGLRLIHELKYWKKAAFITLTYDEKNMNKLQLGISLDKKHPRQFIRELRKTLTTKVKYFLVGEYGEETARPHYHLILFGWKPKIENLFLLDKKNDVEYKGDISLMKIWGKGIVQVDIVNDKAIYYTTGYMLKQKNTKKFGVIQNTYMNCSNGLGYNYFCDNIEKVKKMEITSGLDNNTKPIPRYYIKKLTEIGGKLDKEKITVQKEEKDLATMRKITGKTELNELNQTERQKLKARLTENTLLKYKLFRKHLKKSNRRDI